jgi:acetyl-CoA carboxylase carboxyl transferase subunit alpha
VGSFAKQKNPTNLKQDVRENMHLNYLDFEQPIAELEAKITELRQLDQTAEVNIDEAISKLEEKNRQLTQSIFANLSTMQVVQVARHPMRPLASDYIREVFTDFDELHGDRHYSQGASIIAGTARFNGMPVMVMGHEKGRKTAEKLKRNFGMPRPEDYRKALRLFKMAEKFKMPIITLINTAGAYPGIGAEERNQSEAIARNLFEMSTLKTPIIAIVVGEGGSGGALALGVADRVAMLQYSIYSVISPEGCASILWKTPDKAPEAAEALGLTAQKIKKLDLVDAVIEEPLGGAHRDEKLMAERVSAYIEEQLSVLKALPMDELLTLRYQKLMDYK